MRKDVVIGVWLILACSACDQKPDGQTLAVVNGEEITSSELNGELANANLPAGVDKKQATSRVLQALIDRRLLAEQARKDGVDRSPEYISRQRRMNEDLLIGMMANRQIDTGKLPTEAEITALQNRLPFAFGKREVWKLEQLQYETPTNAAINNKILQTKTLDQLAAVLTESRVPFQRANNQLVTSVIPPELYPRLAGLGPNEPFIVPNGSRSVASAIVSREPAPLVGAPARTEAVNIIRRQNGTQLLQQRLKDLRRTAEIEYKEGYAPPK